MIYNPRRAIGVAFALYIATFIAGLIAGFVSGQDMTSMSTIPDYFWYVGMGISVVLISLFTLWYFRDARIQPSAKSGAYFGLTTVGFSFALDLIIFSFGNAQGAGVDLSAYYSDPRFFVTVILVVLTATLVGVFKSHKGENI